MLKKIGENTYCVTPQQLVNRLRDSFFSGFFLHYDQMNDIVTVSVCKNIINYYITSFGILN